MSSPLVVPTERIVPGAAWLGETPGAWMTPCLAALENRHDGQACRREGMTTHNHGCGWIRQPRAQSGRAVGE